MEDWFVFVYSEEFLHNHLGPYDSKLEALKGIERVKKIYEQKHSDVRRYYSDPVRVVFPEGKGK